jgi:hypothetical protein
MAMDKFNLVESPEDLLRLTMPTDNRYCIVALLRYLQALRPSTRERFWTTQAKVAAAPGQWFELRRRGVPSGYMRVEERSGRYSSTPPQNVSRKDIRVLEMPDPPPTTLRMFLSAMIEHLAAQNHEAATEFLGFRGILDESENESGYLATRQLTSALAYGAGLGVAEAAVMVELENKLLRLFNDFRLRGEVVGILLMLCGVSRQSGPQPALTKALNNLPKTPIHNIAGFGDFVLSGVLAQTGGANWIKEAAQNLSNRVEAKLDEATAAKSIGKFYGAIYSSVPLAYGAKRGFGFLSRSTTADEATDYEVLANQCDERVAQGMAALNVDFGNSMDSRFVLGHRRVVERERRQKGEIAAEMTAIEFIDTLMLYPAFYRPFLLGKTRTLTLSVT